MSNSKLLKEAIADAKAVRETAIANAKIALEEAFTPQLQSILSKKLQAEMEEEEDDVMDEMESSEIGDGDNEEPSAVASDAHTDLAVSDTEEETAEPGEEDENLDTVSEEEAMEENDAVGYDDPTNADDAEISEEEMEDEDELDLESIIRELEMGMEDEEEVSEEEGMDSEEEMHEEDEEGEEMEMDSEEEAEVEAPVEEEDDMDDEIDLEEILREMGYGDDEVTEEEDEEMGESWNEEKEAELEEAYSTIKHLQSTINEVNLLNAKLLYANRLFRTYNLNNEQKSKVVENLDRTTSVREVKLVYATLAESMNFTGTEKKTKRAISESVSSKPVASTAPKKEIISESTNELADRFKQLAGIVK